MRTSTQPRATQRSSARPALRVLAGIVAALLLATTLGQIAHFLLVRHVVCAEHGELLEAPSPALRGHDGHPERAGNAAGEPEPALEHDHCQVLARLQRGTAVLGAQDFELAPPPAPSLIEAEAPAELAPALPPPLTRAPKTSPPEARAA